MAMNDRRGGSRRIFIIILSALTAVTTACLALLRNSIGQSLSVLLGYVILFMSSVLMNLCIAGSTDETKRTALLVFSLGILVFFLGGMIHILFSDDETEYTATPSVAEAHITEHPAEVIGTADDETGIQVADEKDEAYITPIITEPHEMSGSTEETEEPLSHSLDEDYHNDEGPLQSTDPFVAADSEEKASAPAAPEMYFTITDITEDEPVAEEIIFEPPPVPEEITVAETEEESVSPQPAAAETVEAIEVETESEIAETEIVTGISDENEGFAKTETAAEETSEESSADSFDYDSYYADFFADFYVQGRDDMLLEDGIYYMDISINGNNVGSIETEVVDGEAAISKAEFNSYIYGSVEDVLVDNIMDYEGRYLPLDYIASFGVGASFNPNTFVIDIVFSASDMPLQILSIGGGSSRRNSFRPISDGISLDPAIFVLRTRWDFSGSIGSFIDSPYDTLRFTLSSDNTGRINDVYFDFNYSLDFAPDDFNFRMGSYRFYKDFEDSMIRLSWGNVSSDVLSPSGRAFGVRFDRSYAYGGPNAQRRSHLERMLLIDKTSEVIVYNEGREIYRRTLDPGNYRLRDFTLYTGANTITIRVVPLDGSAPSEQTIDIMYSSSLLAPGEVYYGASLVSGRNVSRTKSSRPGVLSIPLGREYLEYDWRNVVLSGYVEAGLTDSLTIHSTLALQNYPEGRRGWNPRVRLNTELTHANILGTTRYNINIGEYMGNDGFMELPRLYARVSHQVSTGWTPISSLNLSFAYSNPEENRLAGRHRFSFSGGLSGRLGFMNWSTSASASLNSDSLDAFSWSTAGTLSFSLSRYFWISASASLSGTGFESPRAFGRVYATVRFGKGSVSASSNFSSIAVSANAYTDNHSFSAGIEASDPLNFNSYRGSADYSYTGKWVGVSIGANADNGFRDGSADFSLSTSTVFADGMFAAGEYIPQNFLLVRQYGALRGNELSAGSAGDSRTEILNQIFGTAVYTGLSTGRGTAFSLYSTSDDSFSGPSIFNINVPPNSEYGYILRLSAEDLYSVSGIVELPDGSVWRNGASPLYAYSEEAGEIKLEQTDNYVFTDGTGRFTVSDLAAGMYAFDVSYGDTWLLAIFEASSVDEGKSGMQIVSPAAEEDSVELPEPYSGVIIFTLDDVLSSNEFWAMLYPEEVAV